MNTRLSHGLAAHLGTANGHLTMDGHDLVALAAEHGSPLFVFSERRLAANAGGFLAAASEGHPRARIFYASKACSNLHVLRIVHREGLGIEVNSGGELWKACVTGYAPERITFNGVAKTSAELRDAIGIGIKTINVESAFELQRIAAIAASLGKRASVALRAVPGIGGGAAAGIQTGSATGKFGMTAPELREAMDIAAANPASLDVAGVHVHIGSQVTDIGDFLSGVEFVALLRREVEQRLGRALRQLNLGGGYPTNYVHRAPGSNVQEAAALQAFAAPAPAAAMVRQVAALAARRLGTDAEIHFEPGRSLVADAAVLIGRVENTRNRSDMPWLYLDAGYHLMIDSVAVRWYYHMLNASRADEAPNAAFRVVGPLCDSADCFFDVEGEYLWKAVGSQLDGLPPEKLAALRSGIVRLPETRNLAEATAPDDYIAMLDTGAYTLGEMFQYCGRQRAKAVMIRATGGIAVLRERDRPEDLIDRAETALADTVVPQREESRHGPPALPETAR